MLLNARYSPKLTINDSEIGSLSPSDRSVNNWNLHKNKSELLFTRDLVFCHLVCLYVRFDDASTSHQVCENINDNTMDNHNSNTTYGDYVKASRVKTRHHPHMNKKHDRNKRK